MTRGLIFNIQRYCVHDGPGIRTTVFLKGCPLRCIWCANPESQAAVPEVCMNEIIGETKTVSEIMAVVNRDAPFYDTSGGGLTLSGGEPLAQAKFAQALLMAAKAQYINTAIETCGAVPWDVFNAVLPYLDHLLMDVKVIDDAIHRQVTGGSNRQILSNLETVGKKYPDLDVLIRTPVIPGVNDNEAAIGAITDFVRHAVPQARYELLKYHELGRAKYTKLGRDYPMGEAKLSDERYEALKKIAEKRMASETGR